MASPHARLPISGDDGPVHRVAAPAPENPWRIVLRLQDRHRYLRLLEPRASSAHPTRGAPARPAGPDTAGRSGTAGRTDDEETAAAEPSPQLDLDAPMARWDHHLLRAPAAMTRTVTNSPDSEQVVDYLAHSADMTMRGGLAAAVAYPLSACALAEHYVFRRLGGSSTGAVAAAATAAAELGRTTPPHEEPLLPPGAPRSAAPDRAEPGTRYVQPGFAGLAETVGWLAGQDMAGQALTPERLTEPLPDWPERERLSRLFRPAPATRPLYRTVVAALRMPMGSSALRRWIPLLGSLFAAPTRMARAVTALVWAGALVVWLGLTVTFLRAAGPAAAGISLPAALLTSLALLATFVIAAGAATVAAYLVGLRTFLDEHAELEHFGLVPGVELPDMAPSRGLAARLDRLAGLPEPDGVPPLVSWLADRIDDLAGIAPVADQAMGPDRPALTFGELWLGRLGTASAAEAELLRRAAEDPQRRTIDLVLTATDTGQGRPYSLPFLTAERAERAGASRFLFCRTCLTAVLPVRVVSQMINASPAQARESTCPRHDGELLQEVPDSWDFPVVAAVRLSMSVPGLLRAVPLYTLDVESPEPLQDLYGRVLGSPPAPTNVYVPRVQWFADGGLTSSFPVHAFDTLLPRWPTFGLNLDHLHTAPRPDEPHQLAEWVTLPEQDAAPRARSWRRVTGPFSYASALLGSASGWRDAMQADLPGWRGRVAIVRHTVAEGAATVFLPQPTILALALRGHQAGVRLRERFTGLDGDVQTQTQTDRYRWTRLRMALRQYRGLSLDIAARLPLYSELAARYQIPTALTTWFTPPVRPGTVDPAWPDAAATLTHLRALSAGGVLDWDTDYGAPPTEVDLRIMPDGG